jgi:hypothetical protein
MAGIFGSLVRMKHPAKAKTKTDILLRHNIQGSGFNSASFAGLQVTLLGVHSKVKHVYNVPLESVSPTGEGVHVYSDTEIRLTLQPIMETFSPPTLSSSATSKPKPAHAQKDEHYPSPADIFSDTDPTQDTLSIADPNDSASTPLPVQVDLVSVDPCAGV